MFLWVLVYVWARQGFSCRKHVDGVYMHTRSVSWFCWEIVPEKHPWHLTGSLSWFSLLGQPPWLSLSQISSSLHHSCLAVSMFISLSGSTMFYFLAEIVQHLFNQWDCTLRSNSANIKTKVFLCFIPSLNPFLLAREREKEKYRRKKIRQCHYNKACPKHFLNTGFHQLGKAAKQRQKSCADI